MRHQQRRPAGLGAFGKEGQQVSEVAEWLSLIEERIEVPVMPWAPSGGRLLRVSAQLYNERADYEALCAALARRAS